MLIKIQRMVVSLNSTIGHLSLDEFSCNTLEDAPHQVKIHGETCIPAGQYQIRLRTQGSKSPAYAKKYPDMHKGMLWLQDVPNFEYVYIHIGNFPKDTEGCILVGLGSGKDSVTGSAAAYEALYPRVADAIERGEDVLIDIVDVERG